jgi:hypothetical protein
VVRVLVCPDDPLKTTTSLTTSLFSFSLSHQLTSELGAGATGPASAVILGELSFLHSRQYSEGEPGWGRAAWRTAHSRG